MSNVISTRIPPDQKRLLEEKAQAEGHRSLSSYLNEIVNDAIQNDKSANTSALKQAQEAILQLEEKERTINSLKSKLARIESHPLMSEFERDGLQLTINDKRYRFKSLSKLLDRLKKKSRIETPGYVPKEVVDAPMEEVEVMEEIEEDDFYEEVPVPKSSIFNKWFLVLGILLVGVVIYVFTRKKGNKSAATQYTNTGMNSLFDFL